MIPETTGEQIWVTVGLLGQSMFFARFLVQWLASERQGKSVIPVVFWYFSITGALVTLAYAVYRLDPVFIIGQLMGLMVYSRNLYFIYRQRRETEVEEATAAE